ncbi:hypothetical protein F4780DRAFT_136836 [Xylariomycetidae sp. FL0641]|nr:hypothetical protein F4780DRAFT_136836 [Xylariomycetidae sp. FL0641]
MSSRESPSMTTYHASTSTPASNRSIRNIDLVIRSRPNEISESPRLSHVSALDNVFSPSDLGQSSSIPSCSSGRTSRFSQASFYENQQFHPGELHDEPRTATQPDIVFTFADPESRPSTPDISPALLAFAGDTRSEIESTTTVDDLGLRSGWYQHMRLRNADSVQGSRQDAYQPLAGVGDKFNLKDTLGEWMKVSKHSRHEDFLPLNELIRLLGDSVIRSTLEKVLHPKDPAFIDRVVDNVCCEDPTRARRKLFATLASIEKADSIVLFIDNDVSDNDLPLRRCGITSLSFYRKTHPENQPPLSFLEGIWTSSDARHLASEQYRFVVPFFDMQSRDVCFYKMDDPKIILPFLTWEDKNRGAKGRVHSTEIHPAHHNFRRTGNNHLFAVKELHKSDWVEYQDEVKNLVRFSRSRRSHRHLIRLLLAFQHGDEYHLMFPMAHGNLVDLWQGEQLLPTVSSNVIWLIKQCGGIANGLKMIHHSDSWARGGDVTEQTDYLSSEKSKGRHGDIKPQNVLYFDPAVPEDHHYDLVISDFGLTRFHSPETISQVAPKDVGGLTLTYRPPEFDTETCISQAYDMWSLGCLYLELLTWFLLGYKARETFTIERSQETTKSRHPRFPFENDDKFFQIHETDEQLRCEVKPSVINWIRKLRELEYCPQSIQDLLEVIESGLLIVDPLRRKKIRFLDTKLQEILEKCKDESYCVKADATGFALDPGHLPTYDHTAEDENEKQILGAISNEVVKLRAGEEGNEQARRGSTRRRPTETSEARTSAQNVLPRPAPDSPAPERPTAAVGTKGPTRSLQHTLHSRQKRSTSLTCNALMPIPSSQESCGSTASSVALTPRPDSRISQDDPQGWHVHGGMDHATPPSKEVHYLSPNKGVPSIRQASMDAETVSAGSGIGCSVFTSQPPSRGSDHRTGGDVPGSITDNHRQRSARSSRRKAIQAYISRCWARLRRFRRKAT